MNKQFDVFGMCNALFDVQAEVDDTALSSTGLAKGSMTLLSEDEQRAILPKVSTRIVNTAAGGSGANTMIGVAQLGGTAVFTSRVGPDEHGKLYAASLSEQNVQPNLAVASGETGVSLVLVSEDAQRTMGTFLGVSRELTPGDVNLDDLRNSKYLYVTGYLWDTDGQKDAVLSAMKTANEAGVKVTFSLSDPFCVGRHQDDFTRLLKDHIDVVFANREEAAMLTGIDDPIDSAKALAQLSGGIAVVTRDSEGAVLVSGGEVVTVDAYPITAIDTTGAGDMYAAGILYGLTRGFSLRTTGRIAAYAAAKVVAHLGPRVPKIDRAAIELLESGF